jgi:hypothetical protein
MDFNETPVNACGRLSSHYLIPLLIMQASERSGDVLYFWCEGCGSELSVPVALHGIDGPCPCCGQTLRAPELVLPPLPPAAVSLPPLDRRHESWQISEPVPEPDWNQLESTGFSGALPSPLETDSSYVLPAGVAKNPLRFLNDDPFAKGRGISGHGGFHARLVIANPSEAPADSGLEDPPVSGKKPAGRLPQFPAFRLVRVFLLVITGGLGAALVLFLKDRQWVLDLPWQPYLEESTAGNLPIPPTPSLPVPAPPETPGLAHPFLAADPFELEQTTSPPVAAPLPDSAPFSGAPLPIASGKN